jgi:hypothetical protein
MDIKTMLDRQQALNKKGTLTNREINHLSENGTTAGRKRSSTL